MEVRLGGAIRRCYLEAHVEVRSGGAIGGAVWRCGLEMQHVVDYEQCI